MKSYSTLQHIGLLLLRLVFGAAIIYGHGWGKVQKIFRGEANQFGDPLGLGPELSLYLVTSAELLCAAMIIIGLFTRLASIPLIIAMSVVVFYVQWKNPFTDMETSLLYLAGFLMILVFGAGRFSIDGYRKKEWL
ncbi:MAG TPA: DoxX family protein [Saprospiraceae bacterium]|nr:DoxX family protein [Saprospiraceae bacterium]